MVGLSMAASWAWGVSIAVSYSILSTKGLLPYFIWAICNIFALLVFGMYILKVPKYFEWMTNPVVKIFMFIIQIFSIWINIKVLVEFTNVYVAIFLSLLMCYAVYVGGFKFSVKSDVIQYTMMVTGLLIIILFGAKVESPQWLISDSYITWAVFGGVGLLSGPFLDMQQLQRAKYACKFETFFFGSLFFGLYMLCVYYSYYTKNSFGGVVVALLLGVSVIGITTSTIDSAIAALHNMMSRQKATIIALIAINSWWIVKSPSVSDFWYLYATSRIYVVIPMIVIAVVKWEWIRSINANTVLYQGRRNIKAILQKLF